jgi:arylsulfatase A-like enzyme
VDERTLADRLRAAGYATALLGKWHLGEEEAFHPQNRGFQDFYGFLFGQHSYVDAEDRNQGPILRGRQKAALDGYLTDRLAREATGFIERNKDRPFFLYLAFNAVHTPLEAPEPTLKQFAGVADPTRRTYLAMVKKLDDAVGVVLAKLRELGLEEDTLIFFLSDNGGPTTKFAPNGARNGGLRGSKGDTWEGGIRVPFFVQWKGRLPAGKLFDHPVSALDIAPTALAAAGVQPKGAQPFDGVNLLPFLEGKERAAPHAALYWRFGEQMAIRKGDWVLVRASLGKREYENIAARPMLFNVAEDIGQERDLAAEQPERARELQADWDRWNAGLRAPRWPATLGGAAFKKQ